MTRHPHHLLNRDRVTDQIRRHGFCVVPVGFHTDDDAFSYTIGRAGAGAPELVVTGLSPVHASQLITYVQHEFLRGMPLAQQRRHWLGDAPFIIRPVSPHWLANDPARMAAWFEYLCLPPRSAHHPAIAQVVWGDAAGRFPGDPFCDPLVAEDQHIIADDPFGFPRRSKHGQHQHRDERRHLRLGWAAASRSDANQSGRSTHSPSVTLKTSTSPERMSYTQANTTNRPSATRVLTQG
ncbi:MAG: hypothetical protein RLZZ623_113 [Actinomycetota bacterium]